jgi:hypothetical protein
MASGTTDRAVTKICGVFLLMSGVLGLALAPFAMHIGYPIFANFGDASMLLHFAATWPLPLWFALLSSAVPALALSSGLGFYHVLREEGSLVVLAVVLLSFGLMFTVAQDGIELTLVTYLPLAYAAADSTARPALLAIGNVGTAAMSVFAGQLGTIGYVGIFLLNWAMLKRGWPWTLLAGTGLFAAVAIVIAGTLSAQFPVARAGFPIGFILLRLWMIVMGVIMFRWRPLP